MNITSNEFALLDKILHDEFQPTNGSTPEDFSETNHVWAFVLETKSEGGTFTALKQKGLVGFQKGDRRDDDDTVWVTEEGFAVWQAARQEVA